MEHPNRTGPFLLVLLLLFQTVALMPAAANPTSGTVNTFDGGQASPTLTLTGGQVDTSLGIEVPRNVTFNSASFLVSAKDEVATPGQVYIDIGEDGVKEWAFEGSGYGNLGHQNSFFNGNTSVDFHSTGMTMSPPVFLPFGASVDSADVNVSFAPDVNGGLLPIGSVDDYTSGDVDNDTLPEVVVLSRDSNATGFNAALMIVDWTLNAGLNTSSWVQTCAGSSEVATGDFNGDGHDDLVAFAYGSDLACVHLMNAATGAIGAAQSIALYSNSISASAGDFDLDGYADLISIHSGGTFALRTYNDKTNSFTSNLTHTVNMNGTTSATTLAYLTAGVFANNSTTFSAVVTDLFGHSTPLSWVNASGITENPNHFDGLGSQPIAGDVDGDGDIDFIGTNQQGYTIALNMGLQWNASNVLATNDLASASALNNASVFDHDGDGVNSLVVPYPGADDGNTQTIDGNLTAYLLNSTAIGNPFSVIQPWSVPRNALGVDMNGDGLLEHIVPAGDSSLGLFIGAWNQIAMDIDSDGQDDLHAIGYAGDALYGMEPLYILDPLGNMTTKLSPLTNALPYNTDGYGVRLCSVSFSFANMADGNFNLSSMDIGYDAAFIVENNPFSAGNLTNIINQQQTAGVGNFVVTLPVNSTLSGIFAVSGLVAQYSPGAPNISLPPTPVVSVTELTSERVQLEWQDMVDFGEDLIEFEVFRAAPGVSFDLTSPYTTSGANTTVDGDVEHGISYVYGVRSLHSYGVTSNMSVPLSVAVPFPAPPAAVAGFTFVDTPTDQGGSLDLSWNISIDGAIQYGVYLETQAIETIDALQPIATIAHTTENPIMALSTVNEGLIIVDGTDYYAAVVAFDEYGNATTSFSALGPVISLNNSQRTALIEYDLSTSSTYDDGEFGLSALDSLHLNITLTADGAPLEGELLSLTIEASGVDVELSGTTDSSGVWRAIEVEDLTALGGTFITFFDSASMSIEYLGTTGSPTMQPVGAANLTLQGFGLLRADVTMLGAQLNLDDEGVFELEVNIAAELPTQNTYLEGLAYTWEQKDASGNVTSTGEVEVKGGQIILSGTANATDTLVLTSDASKSWIVPSMNPLMFTFTGGPDTGSNQTTDGNGTNDTNTTQEPTFPDATLPGTVDCGTATYPWIDDGNDALITCTITNPNSFDVFLGFSWKVTPTTPPPFTFEAPFGVDSGPPLTISATASIQVDFSPVRNGPSDGLFPGIQGVGYTVFFSCSELGGANQCDSMTTPTASTEGELQWTLGEAPEVETPADAGSDETKANTPLVIGGIIGVLAIIAGGAAVILLRKSEEEEDDWYAESIDEVEPEIIEKPTKPTSKSLDQLQNEGRSLDDVEGPKDHRPSLFDEFDNNTVESYDESEVQALEEELDEEETTEEAEEDDGISVDENGTEWWEDEEGVWWYREEGWEDWAVWED